jgi:fructokinase
MTAIGADDRGASITRHLHSAGVELLAPGAAAVKALLEQSHRKCMVTYDPNIRPALLGSHAEALSNL